MSRHDIAELALNNNHPFTQILISNTFIVLGVHNTESHYVETIPVVRVQPYDQYDIAQNTGTIHVTQEQPYDQYDIAQNTGTINVTQEQPYEIMQH